MTSLVLTLIGWALMCVIMHPSFAAFIAALIALGCLSAARWIARGGG